MITLDPPYDGHAIWHEHYFMPDGYLGPHQVRGEEFDKAIEMRNELCRYDAVEDHLGRIFVWCCMTGEVIAVCKTHQEACDLAQAMATI